MRRVMGLFALLGAVSAGSAGAEGERAGAFDYYVLALSWTPTWCALEGDARRAPDCDDGADRTWTLHGLWPQDEVGWPSYCTTPHREATRGETRAMADVMGSSGLAWHQWKKHGRCSGLRADDYFALTRLAWDRIAKPEVLEELDRPVTLPAAVVEDAFLDANPQLAADGVTVTCRDRRIQEVRICLTRDLAPRDCGRDVVRDCTMRDALLDPAR